MIAVDIHGHGDTTGRDEFTFWDTATDIALLLDNFNIRNVVICGTSQGGFVATRLALHRPDLVKRIVYAGSTLLLETPESYAGITHLTTGFPGKPEKEALMQEAVKQLLQRDDIVPRVSELRAM
ncbi:Alpha/Beta hydrolase protein [Trichophaea hybrida]|nr:Alpha/Beta hydrolase protein [Trichophaea hybrida]